MTQRTVYICLFCSFLFAFSACDSGDPSSPEIDGPPARVVDTADYITTPSGLQYFDFVVGTGPVAAIGDTVVVNYTGWFDDRETIFDSSVHIPGRTPILVVIGVTNVIQGWTEALQGMQQGGERQIVLPPGLAYGQFGSPSGVIPPNATILFEIEIVQVRKGRDIEGPDARMVTDAEYTTTTTGLKYFDFMVGTGPVAAEGDTLTVDYTLWAEDRMTIIDSSIYIEGRMPFSVIIGETNVIQGWTEGLQGMQTGGERQLVLPPDLAYGQRGAPGVPPNSTLIFEVEVKTLAKGS